MGKISGKVRNFVSPEKWELCYYYESYVGK